MACRDLTYEPTLDELLAEPIIQILMASDGVREEDLRSAFNAAQIG